MVRKHKPDPVMVHLESYPYRRFGDELNAGLMEHLKEEHTTAWARWSVGNAIGDPEDEHYMEHGKLTTRAEAAREIALDASVARHPAGKKIGKLHAAVSGVASQPSGAGMRRGLPHRSRTKPRRENDAAQHTDTSRPGEGQLRLRADPAEQEGPGVRGPAPRRGHVVPAVRRGPCQHPSPAREDMVRKPQRKGAAKVLRCPRCGRAARKRGGKLVCDGCGLPVRRCSCPRQ